VGGLWSGEGGRSAWETLLENSKNIAVRNEDPILGPKIEE
jgi:hypothetical protein